MATPIPDNQARFSLDEIARATGGFAQTGGHASVGGVTTDSRAEVQGKLFVALTGERFDGHAYASDVLSRGAHAVVVSREVELPAGSSAVRVADTTEALGALARFHRRRWGKTVVAVGGSAGKTTTKGAIAALLGAARPGAVHFERGNLNNLVGAPMVLLGLTDAHAVCVVELGTNQTGEVARLTRVAEPDVAVLTLVAIEHSEGIGDLDAIDAEEGALFDLLGPAATAIGNADDVRVARRLAASPAAHKIRYGSGAGADYRVVAREPLDLHRSRVEIARPAGGPVRVVTGLLGAPGALALAAALAVTERVVGGPLPAEVIEGGLAALGAGEAQRLCPIELSDGSVVVDDSYNANPASVLSSAQTAREIAQRRGARLLLVVGEMRELGPLSVNEHRELGRALATLGADGLIAVGGDAEHLASAAGCTFAKDADEALALVLAVLRAGDVVLVKASRGVRAERVVEGLVRAKGRAA